MHPDFLLVFEIVLLLVGLPIIAGILTRKIGDSNERADSLANLPSHFVTGAVFLVLQISVGYLLFRKYTGWSMEAHLKSLGSGDSIFYEQVDGYFCLLVIVVCVSLFRVLFNITRTRSS